jgi:serine protease Do
MKRVIALALGAPAVLALALMPGDVKAGGSEAPDQKVEKKVVVRHTGGGRLGVTIGETTGDVRGAVVRSVAPASAAEKAGLKQDDVIVRFDGETVRGTSQLARLVEETPTGRPVAIEVRRGAATEKLTATLSEGDRRVHVFNRGGYPGMEDFDIELPEPPDIAVAPMPPAPPHAPGAAPHAPHPPIPPHVWSWNGEDGPDMVFRMLGGGPRKLGVEYMELGEQLASYFKLAGKSGVLVTSVDADGPAAKAGIKAGDVILKLDGAAIAESSDLRDAISKAEGGQEVAITVQRDGHPLDLKATLAKPEPRMRRREARGVSL